MEFIYLQKKEDSGFQYIVLQYLIPDNFTNLNTFKHEHYLNKLYMGRIYSMVSYVVKNSTQKINIL